MMVTDREYQPIAEVELDWCIVCESVVFDDPRGQRNDYTSPVQTRDGCWTHAGCELDYERVAAALAQADGAADVLLDQQLDGYLATATSWQTERNVS